MIQLTRILFLAAALGLASLASAGTVGLLQAEHDVLGARAAALPSLQEIGGSDIGGTSGPSGGGPRDLGEKLRAGALSLVLPGLGQLYNGDRGKALAFGSAEAAVWTTWLVLHTTANHAQDDYIEYAGLFAGVTGDHDDRYWRDVGRHLTSDDYNLQQEMIARAEGREPTNLIGEADSWFWRNEEYQDNYKDLRADANRAYDRRDLTVLFAIVNRAVSAYDAVRNAGGDHMVEVAGLGIDLESRRVFGRTSTACVVSGRF